MIEKEGGKLLVVGTPIGNLSDFSPRGVQALQEADFIAAEDTRVTRKLLNHFEIKKELVSYYAHQEGWKAQKLCDRILEGETCALVSDAGMPAISDPGELLVAACIEQGIPVYTVPGPTAFASAIAISGLPTGRFTFEGFLSMNKKNRRAHLEALKAEQRTMIFYEAPHKLAATLQDMFEMFGDRKIALARELTKIHEEVIRTTLSEAAQRYQQENARGEFVLVVEGAKKVQEQTYTLQQAEEIAREWIEKGCPPTEAARRAARATGLRKNEIYEKLI